MMPANIRGIDNKTMLTPFVVFNYNAGLFFMPTKRVSLLKLWIF